MRNSKVMFLFMAMTLFASWGSASAGQFGAPEPVARSGYFSLGGGYFYNSNKWKLGSNSQDYKFRQNELYLQWGVAVNKMEFYIRGGGADLKFENAFSNGDFNDNYNLFGTMGVRGIIDITDSIGIGLFAQGSLFSTYKSQSTGLVNGISTTQQLEIKNLNEVDLGLMLQGKINRICIYAGPFVYWTDAKIETTIISAGSSTPGSSSLNQTNNFGGVAGIRIPVYPGINVEVEGQYRQELSAGGAITFSF